MRGCSHEPAGYDVTVHEEGFIPRFADEIVPGNRIKVHHYDSTAGTMTEVTVTVTNVRTFTTVPSPFLSGGGSERRIVMIGQLDNGLGWDGNYAAHNCVAVDIRDVGIDIP